MRAADFLSGFLALALGLWITAAGWDLGLGTLGEPGSGFMFFWIGVAMTALSVGVLVLGARQPPARGLRSLWAGVSWRKIPYVALLLVLYSWLLPTLGFPLVTVLLLLVLFKTVEPQGWGVAVIGAVASTAVAYLVFDRWLGTQLPVGELWAR